jgi:3-oxoacyl-[acyl-carrier-protein] synthase II
MNKRPISVTGMGCICAAGADVPRSVASLFEGKRNLASPSRFRSTHPTIYPVFEVPGEFLPEKLRRREDLHLTGKLALAAASEAISDAGLTTHEIGTKRAGVCVGTTVGSAMNDEEFYRGFRMGGNPDMAPIRRYLAGNPAALIAREFSLDGPCQTVVNACCSGTDAIGIGLSWIRSGICDLVLAGGADELCHVTYNGFISLMVTDGGPCKPFDRDRKGLNLGEGAGILVLESEDSHRERKARGRSVLLGYGSSSDAYHLTAPHPEGDGLRRALCEAVVSAGDRAGAISFVNVHGTGTSDNDRVESGVLAELLPGVPFLSTKGYTGHTLGAAGGIEAVFTLACLEMGKIPPSAGFSVRDPVLPAYPVDKTTVLRGDLALSQSLAFGGSNGVLVFGRG